jgi:hypothetical protein
MAQYYREDTGLFKMDAEEAKRTEKLFTKVTDIFLENFRNNLQGLTIPTETHKDFCLPLVQENLRNAVGGHNIVSADSVIKKLQWHQNEFQEMLPPASIEVIFSCLKNMLPCLLEDYRDRYTNYLNMKAKESPLRKVIVLKIYLKYY